MCLNSIAVQTVDRWSEYTYTLLIRSCLKYMVNQGSKWMREMSVSLLSEQHLFIYLGEMESLSGRMNEMSNPKSG